MENTELSGKSFLDFCSRLVASVYVYCLRLVRRPPMKPREVALVLYIATEVAAPNGPQEEKKTVTHNDPNNKVRLTFFLMLRRVNMQLSRRIYRCCCIIVAVVWACYLGLTERKPRNRVNQTLGVYQRSSTPGGETVGVIPPLLPRIELSLCKLACTNRPVQVLNVVNTNRCKPFWS